jgi:hypothetical protein
LESKGIKGRAGSQGWLRELCQNKELAQGKPPADIRILGLIGEPERHPIGQRIGYPHQEFELAGGKTMIGLAVTPN